MLRAAILALVLPLTGCATIVFPPGGLADPAPVFITDYDRHSSLVFPTGDGRLVEFGYGQFDWYALEKDEWWRVPALLFVPQQGPLAREEWQGPPTVRGVASGRRVQEILRVEVELADRERLLTRLEKRFAAASATRVRNDHYGLTFVCDDDDYCVLHSCNSAVAEWLRELGCCVPEESVSANYELRSPGSAPRWHGP